VGMTLRIGISDGVYADSADSADSYRDRDWDRGRNDVERGDSIISLILKRMISSSCRWASLTQNRLNLNLAAFSKLSTLAYGQVLLD